MISTKFEATPVACTVVSLINYTKEMGQLLQSHRFRPNTHIACRKFCLFHYVEISVFLRKRESISVSYYIVY